MTEGRRTPLVEVSNLPRAQTSASGLGVKRPFTPSVTGGSPTKRQSAYSNRYASARRGTVSSIPAPPKSTGTHRQTEYERKTENASNSALSGRVRATMTFSQANSRPRPQLRTTTVSASSEASRMEQRETVQKEMQMKIDLLHQFAAASRNDTSSISEEVELLRVKLGMVEAQITDAKKEVTEKINQLNEAELELKTKELQLMQHSSTANRLLADCRRKATAAEEDLRKWIGKVEDIKSARNSLEKRYAYERMELDATVAEVDRLEKDHVALRRKHDVFDVERDGYLTRIRQLEDSLSNAEARKTQAVLEFEGHQARIGQLKSDLTSENLNVKSLKNELLALGAQHEETIVQCKQEAVELRRLQNEREMKEMTFEKQLGEAKEKNAEIRENFVNRVEELKKSLCRAQESLAEAEQKAIADEKSLSTHDAEVSRIRQENRLIRARIESKNREISEKDAAIAELAVDIARVQGQKSETEKIIAKLRSELQRLKRR